MALFTQRYNVAWRDARGWVGRNTFFVTGTVGVNTADDYNAAADTLINAIIPMTNAALQSVAGPAGYGIITLTYGTAAQYIASWMKCVMTFSTGSEQMLRLKIPAPKTSYLLSDQVTVINDGTNALVTAFVDAVKNADTSGTYVSTAGGLPYTHFEGGLVRLGKEPRRINGRIKSSHLVAGEEE
jgi:hypothetical protein